MLFPACDKRNNYPKTNNGHIPSTSNSYADDTFDMESIATSDSESLSADIGLANPESDEIERWGILCSFLFKF